MHPCAVNIKMSVAHIITNVVVICDAFGSQLNKTATIRSKRLRLYVSYACHTCHMLEIRVICFRLVSIYKLFNFLLSKKYFEFEFPRYFP